MKRIWIFVVVVATIASVSAFGDPLERLYVELDQVIFDATGIYIEVDNCYHEIDAIVFDKDESRYYALKKEAKWKCGNCGKYNDPKTRSQPPGTRHQ